MSNCQVTIDLDGLDGSNPMGFLAGLGVLDVLSCRGLPSRLRWTEDLVPRARLKGTLTRDELIHAILTDKAAALTWPLLRFPTIQAPVPDVKFRRDELRGFLESCRSSEPSAALSAALVCEWVFDKSDNAAPKAKPTDLHFTAGRQHFLDIARELAAAVDAAQIEEALFGPWRYESTLKSFMWDSTDDRDYALAATKPSDKKKGTVPGAEWLAFRGLTLLPVMPVGGRVWTPGAGGAWKRGWFTWPLWIHGANAPTARSLMQAMPREKLLKRDLPNLLTAWGVHRVFRCMITRSDQGGYGQLRPPTLVWSRAMQPAQVQRTVDLTDLAT